MDRILADIRFALFSMVRAPLIFLLAIVSLGIGVAANTTIFSALDAFLIRPLPYPDANSLVRVWTTNQEQGWTRNNVSQPDYLDWRDRTRTLNLSAYAGGSMNVSGGDSPERLQGLRVTSNLFDVLNVHPQIGRAFTPDEDRQGGDKVVIISYAFWQRHFAGSANAVGSSLLLDGVAHTVIGVMPEDFHFPRANTDIYTPLRPNPTAARGERWFTLLGRLVPGATLDRAAKEMDDIAHAVAADHAESKGDGASVVRLDHAMFNTEFRTAATICMVAVLFVLLIACANVANLLLARAATREREIALRSVLGAGRWRVVSQLLTESIVLALIGGALGYVMSIWGVRGLISILPPQMDMQERIALNGRALGFTALISLGAGIVFGLAPALHAARPDLSNVLRDAGSRGSIGGGRAGRLRASFVVAEIALALVLLICAGLLIKGYRVNVASDLGFNPDHLATMRITMPEAAYTDTAKLVAFQDEVLTRVRAVNGAKGAALAVSLPMQGGNESTYTTADTRSLPDSKQPVATYRVVSTGYFDALGIKIEKGRDFQPNDRMQTVPVAVINETLAKKHWPSSSPLGEQIEIQGVTRQIVGVAHDVHEYGGGELPPPMVYAPLAQVASRSVAIALRSDLPMDRVMPPLRQTIKTLDPNMPVFDIMTMQDRMRNWDGGDRVLAQLLAIFAGFAFLLAVLGVYGVMAYNVAQRTQEVGIRMAIGAQQGDIVRLILRHGTILAGAGVMIGLALAFGVARFLSAFLNGVSPFDPMTFATFTVALFLTGLIASYVPARRATRVDPLTALRVE